MIELPSDPPGRELAGSLPLFPTRPGSDLAGSMHLPDFRRKCLLFGRLDQPGAIHVYSAECRAGERLRMQMLVPILPMGRALAPAFAVIAQSLPYSADVHKLPFDLPTGYSAVVAPPPGKLVQSVRDALTRVRYYPGPAIDTKTLVGGRCYVVVWSPDNTMGKYMLQIGHRWPFQWTYWLQIPRYWWQVRGWFGKSRALAYAGAMLLALMTLLGWLLIRRGRRRPR